MASELRDTGISVVGDVPWGTHFCYFYETKQDLLDILVPYFKAGLDGNEFCLWIVSNSELITSEGAKAALGHAVPRLDQYLSEGRIEIVPHDQWWFLKSRTFDLHRVVHQFKEKLDDALAAGYVGMRVNGSPAWMRTERHEELCEFEKEVDRLYPSLRIIVACTYPVGASTADLLFDVACSHRFTIARRRGKWDVLDTPALLQAKQQIEQLNRELEQRVRERTKELETANEKLGEEIKERKRAEEQARKVLDTIPALIGSGTSNGILDYCNQQWLAYAGVSLEELQKDETLHPDDKARVVRAWQEAMATGKPYELEQRYRRFDGVYRWFLARGVPLKDAEGVIERWYGTLTDIEDRKQAEEALVESRRKLKEAQRLANIGYWERDLLTDRLTFSKETAAIFGLSRRVFTQTEFQQMLHPDDRKRQELALKEALRGQRRYDNEYRIILPDGGTRFIHASDEIIYDAAGHPVRMFGAVQDVTERKQADETLRTTSEQLRALSSSLQSAREEESKRIAREIHDELGGALTSWHWDLEEIRDAISDPIDSSQVASVRTKIDAMIKLTETTLDTVRKLSSELRPMALELGLVEAIEWQALQFRERTGISVELICSMQKVDLDDGAATAVFRILQEALTNIQRHAQATKVRIAARQQSGEFILTVNDNGRGITEIEKSAPQSLGLLGMRERAHLVGGEITITNAERGGTEITVSIPLTEREVTAHH
jgi:PAS domain S-box-containing protein